MRNLIFTVVLTLFIITSNLFSQSPLPIGGKAPDFIAENSEGVEVQLSKELKKGPVVIIFYRGNWCQYCNSYMAALEDSLSMINKEGASVIAITPESSTYVNVTREKTNASFQIIPDKGHKIMDMYNVSYKLGAMKTMAMGVMGIRIKQINTSKDRILPVPATYVIDENGIIRARHFDTDYTYRMSITDIINAVMSINYRKLIARH